MPREPSGSRTGTTGAQPTLLRELNERAVLETIFAGRAVSRAEIARRTGMSKPTVSLAIRSLEADGLVAEVGTDTGRPGRSGVLYSVVATAAIAAAVEIGVNRVRANLVDLTGRSLAEHSRPIRRQSASGVWDAVGQCLDVLVDAAGHPRSKLLAVTVAMPGVIHPATGVLTRAGTMPQLDGTRPAPALSKRLGLDVAVMNDVDLAAMGEQAHGAGRGVENFAVLWAGDGFGAGIVCAGRLQVGHRGGAGEVADIPMGLLGSAAAPTTPVDVSDFGFICLAQELVGAMPTSSLEPPFEPARILDAAATDAGAALIRDRFADWVAWYAAALTALLDPELLVLAGPLLSHEALLEPVRRALAAMVTDPPNVTTSRLGDRAQLVGALSQARRDAFERAFERRGRAARGG